MLIQGHLGPTIWGIDPAVFGALSQAIGALGTVGAVAVALGIAIKDGRRRDRERREEKAAQARTITAVIEQRKLGKPMPFLANVVVVANHGTWPIADLLLEDMSGQINRSYVHRWELRQADDRQSRTHGPIPLCEVLGPGEEFVSSAVTFSDTNSNGWVDKDSGSVTITFLDAHGNRWRRVSNAAPELVTDSTRTP